MKDIVWMYKLLKRVLTGIRCQFIECELKLMHKAPYPQTPVYHRTVSRPLDRLYPLIYTYIYIYLYTYIFIYIYITKCWHFMQMKLLNEAAKCHDFGDPVSITRLLPLISNTPSSCLRPSLSNSLTPPLLLLLSAESQSSPLISTML